MPTLFYIIRAPHFFFSIKEPLLHYRPDIFDRIKIWTLNLQIEGFIRKITSSFQVRARWSITPARTLILCSSISLYLTGIRLKFPDKHRYFPSLQWSKVALVRRTKWLPTLKSSSYLYILSPFCSNILIIILHNISVHIGDGLLECTERSCPWKGSVATSSSTFLSFRRIQAFSVYFLGYYWYDPRSERI